MNKKLIGLFLAVAMIASVIAGCTAVPAAAPAGEATAAPTGEASTPSFEPVTLEFSQW